MRVNRWVGLFIVLLLIVAACADDAEETTTTTAAAEETTTTAAAEETTTTAAEETTTTTAAELSEMEEAGLAAAGDPVDLPMIKVGYLQWIRADESGFRIEEAARIAVEEVLGWEWIACDAEGDFNKFPVCGNSLLDQGIDAMITDAIPEALITDVLERAKTMEVPVVATGGSQDTHDLYDGTYEDDDYGLGFELGKKIVDVLGDEGEIILFSFPTKWAKLRDEGLADAIEGTNITVVDESESDPTNLVDGTKEALDSKLIQFPDADVVWVDFSVAGLGAAQSIDAAFPGTEFPDRPGVFSFYANLSTLDSIRAGVINFVAEEALEWTSWAGVDQLAQFFARGTPFDQNLRPDYGVGGFARPVVVGPDNLPPEGELVPPPLDFETFFKTKWAAEFGIGG